MINEALEFMAKSSIQVMLGKDKQSVVIQFIPDTTNNSFNLKIENHPFSQKYNNIGQVLTKQNIQQLMDAPMSFNATATINPNSDHFKEVWHNNEKFAVKISPEDAYAELLLKAFSKSEPSVEITAREIPNFDNPKI